MSRHRNYRDQRSYSIGSYDDDYSDYDEEEEDRILAEFNREREIERDHDYALSISDSYNYDDSAFPPPTPAVPIAAPAAPIAAPVAAPSSPPIRACKSMLELSKISSPAAPKVDIGVGVGGGGSNNRNGKAAQNKRKKNKLSNPSYKHSYLPLPHNFKHVLSDGAEASSGPNLFKHSVTCSMLGHVDHGKTTLLSSIYSLFYQSRISLDSTETEIKRGCTTGVTSVSFLKDGIHFTMLDTPGHTDLKDVVIPALIESDVAVVVIDCAWCATIKDSTEAEKARVLSTLNTPHYAGVGKVVVAFNKTDKVNAGNIEKFRHGRDAIVAYCKEISTKHGQKKDAFKYCYVSSKDGKGIEDFDEGFAVVLDSDIHGRNDLTSKKKKKKPGASASAVSESLLSAIASLHPPRPLPSSPPPLLATISSISPSASSSSCICTCKVIRGKVSVGDTVRVLPIGAHGKVTGYSIKTNQDSSASDDTSDLEVDKNQACSSAGGGNGDLGKFVKFFTKGTLYLGSNVSVHLSLSIPLHQVTDGSMLVPSRSISSYSIRRRFKSLVICVNVNVLWKGVRFVLYLQNQETQAVVIKIKSPDAAGGGNADSGASSSSPSPIVNKDKYITLNSCAEATVVTASPIVVDSWDNVKKMARFVGVKDGVVVLWGRVTELL